MKEREELFGGLFSPTQEWNTMTDRRRSSSIISYDDQLSLKIPNFYVEIGKPDFKVDLSYQFLFAICTSEKPIQYLTLESNFL